MVEGIFDSLPPRGRVEIRTGVGQRRRWSDEEKGRIVAESYGSGAVVSEVARRHEMSPQHLFAWRKAARTGRLTPPGDEGLLFVPVVTPVDASVTVGKQPGCGSITIEIAGAVVHAERGVDLSWLSEVLAAVKAAR